MQEPMFVNLTGKIVRIYRMLTFGHMPKPSELIAEIPPNGSRVTLNYAESPGSVGQILLTRRSSFAIEGLPAKEVDKDYKFFIVPREVGPYVPADRTDVLWPPQSSLAATFTTPEEICSTGLEGVGAK